MVSSEFAVGQKSVFASTLLSVRTSALASVPPPPMLSLFVLRPSVSMKDYICGRNRYLKPNPTPDKAKSLYNAQ